MSSNVTTLTASTATTEVNSACVPTINTFPTAEIIDVLLEEFVAAVMAEMEFLEVHLPEDPNDIARMAFDIDSLLAIEILLAVDDVIGVELPSSVVNAGGYESVDNAIATLLPKIEKQWNKHNGVTP